MAKCLLSVYRKSSAREAYSLILFSQACWYIVFHDTTAPRQRCAELCVELCCKK